MPLWIYPVVFVGEAWFDQVLSRMEYFNPWAVPSQLFHPNAFHPVLFCSKHFRSWFHSSLAAANLTVTATQGKRGCVCLGTMIGPEFHTIFILLKFCPMQFFTPVSSPYIPFGFGQFSVLLTWVWSSCHTQTSSFPADTPFTSAQVWTLAQWWLGWSAPTNLSTTSGETRWTLPAACTAQASQTTSRQVTLTNLQWFSVVWTLIYHDLRHHVVKMLWTTIFTS